MSSATLELPPARDLPAHLSPQRIAAAYDVDEDTIVGWIKRGIRAAGLTHRLVAVKVGGQWRVPVSAWREFVALCNPGLDPDRVTAPTPAAVDRDAKAATRRARKRLGIG